KPGPPLVTGGPDSGVVARTGLAALRPEPRPVKEHRDEALCHLPHEYEHRRPDVGQPVAAGGEPHGGAVRAYPRAARQRLLADRPRHRREYAKADAYPDHPGEVFPREPWFVRRDAAAYGIALHAYGKIAWGRTDIGGDPIVAVLTEQVSDAHLAGLRRDGVSYIFAGKQELDL